MGKSDPFFEVYVKRSDDEPHLHSEASTLTASRRASRHVANAKSVSVSSMMASAKNLFNFAKLSESEGDDDDNVIDSDAYKLICTSDVNV